ncbi:MAG: hypothetical protein NZ555_11785 [Geminicoccaceae bacterium]|nr:hypothetical protein [Geminicoccaceae bacterium]MCX8100198.1 hypothetical protein [Geminicoccaceae bacterium]MDW8371356.1 hypothetical protein [Geminicoccaceae bacterium]
MGEDEAEAAPGLALEPPAPGGEELVTYTAGRFVVAAPPSWYLAALEAAERRAVPWPQAMADATGCSDARLLPIEDLRTADLAVWCWLTPEGGRYVEIVDASACQLAVYVPDPADWPAFWAAHVMPALQLQVLSGLRRELARLARASRPLRPRPRPASSSRRSP